MLSTPTYFIEQNNPYKKISLNERLYINFTYDY